MNIKMWYDFKHQQLVLKKGDNIYLKLYKGYLMSEIYYKFG